MHARLGLNVHRDAWPTTATLAKLKVAALKSALETAYQHALPKKPKLSIGRSSRRPRIETNAIPGTRVIRYPLMVIRSTPEATSIIDNRLLTGGACAS